MQRMHTFDPALRTIDVKATMTQIDLSPTQRTQLLRAQASRYASKIAALSLVELHPRLRAASINRSTSVSVKYSLCLYAAFGWRRGSVRFTAIGVVSVIDANS
jgi:hypothetical protein